MGVDGKQEVRQCSVCVYVCVCASYMDGQFYLYSNTLQILHDTYIHV